PNKAVEPNETRFRAGQSLGEQPHAASVRHTEFQYCRWYFFPDGFGGNVVKSRVLICNSRCRVRPIQPLERSLPQQFTNGAVPLLTIVAIAQFGPKKPICRHVFMLIRGGYLSFCFRIG